MCHVKHLQLAQLARQLQRRQLTAQVLRLQRTGARAAAYVGDMWSATTACLCPGVGGLTAGQSQSTAHAVPECPPKKQPGICEQMAHAALKRLSHAATLQAPVLQTLTVACSSPGNRAPQLAASVSLLLRAPAALPPAPLSCLQGQRQAPPPQPTPDAATTGRGRRLVVLRCLLAAAAVLTAPAQICCTTVGALRQACCAPTARLR